MKGGDISELNGGTELVTKTNIFWCKRYFKEGAKR